MRLNSGSSNQSKNRVSRKRFNNGENNLGNKDLLKDFDMKLENCEPSFDQIQQLLHGQDLEVRMMKAMDNAKLNIRMEEPKRMLTRLAFDFMSELIQDFSLKLAFQPLENDDQ